MILEPEKRNQVLPLPVVLISTISSNGIRNVAPWSCFMPILRPLDLVVLASWLKRDTLDNIRQTGEFVVNVPPEEMAEKLMICAKDYAPDIDEFEMSGLIPKPSSKVKPPRVDGCIAWMECHLEEEILRDRYSLLIGKVIYLEADDCFFNEQGEMYAEKAKPLTSLILGYKPHR